MRKNPTVKVLRYSDPERTMLAKNAAIFLGKPDEDNVRRPLSLLRKKHTSIFRGECVDFEFVASKVVYDHLITYTTQQRRACAGLRANRAGDFVVPLEVVGTPLEDALEQIGQKHRNDYLDFIDGVDPLTDNETQKARPQAARAVAPMSVNLHFTFQFNFLTLMGAIFPQRLWEPGAQQDTKEVVQMMWDAVRTYDPELWDVAEELFGAEAILWDKLRHVLKKQDITTSETMEDLRSYIFHNAVDPNASIVEYLIREHAPKGSMWS